MSHLRLLAVAAFVTCLLGSAQPHAQNAYITNFNSASVSVIDTATNAVTATIGVGSNPLGVAVTRDGSKVYVTHQNNVNSTVAVIDTATNEVTATIPVGANPGFPGIAVTPDGSKVYVASSGNTVSVIDAATNTVTATVGVGNSPFGVAVTPDGSRSRLKQALRAKKVNYRVGWKRLPVMRRLESSHSPPEATTPDTASISALPLAGRRAEEYPLS
jgi:YVTN family beta-propeller protein